MCKILIADDSYLFRRSLRSYLEQNPKVSVCGEAEDGLAAVDKFKELNPDIVILDWQMPVMNGIEAARRIARLAQSRRGASYPAPAALRSPNKLRR